MSLSDLDTFSTQYDDTFSTGDGSLRINWYNGTPMLRTPGAFFVSQRRLEQVGADSLDNPWKKVTRVFASGEEEDGWETAKLKLAPIGIRTQDVNIKPDGVLEFLTGRFSRENRPSGWSVYTELLCMVEGWDGPVKWSAKRIKTSMAIINGWRAYRKEILDEARRTRKNPRIPAWAFWATVASAVDAKGKPIYEDTSENGPKVTPPVWQWPLGSTEERISAMYVGKTMLNRGEALRSEFNMFFTTNVDGSPNGSGNGGVNPSNGSHSTHNTAPELDSF
jgi:hypothetical protein